MANEEKFAGPSVTKNSEESTVTVWQTHNERQRIDRKWRKFDGGVEVRVHRRRMSNIPLAISETLIEDT